MNYFTSENIDFIYDDVKKRGITMEVLLNEMVDHICCSIEPEINKGISFHSAYNNLMNTLENSTFKNLQHQTLLSTNLKFQNMKKAMFASGFLGSLLMFMGVIFKIQHWPGAAISMLLGSVIVIFGFLPLFFYISYKEQVEKKNIFLTIIGYLTLSFLILGPLFKIMHWPYTDKLLFFGPVLLIVFFLPVYLVSIFRKASETKTNFLYILIIVGIGLSSFFMLSSLNLSKEAINKYASLYHNNQNVIKLFVIKNDSLVSQYKLEAKYETQKQNFENIQINSSELNHLINNLMYKMIQASNNQDLAIKELKTKGDKKACRKIMEQDRNDIKLKESLDKYRNSLLSMTNDDCQKEIINSHLGFDIFNNADDFSFFKNSTLIEALATLTSLQKNIQIAEYEMLTQIIHNF